MNVFRRTQVENTYSELSLSAVAMGKARDNRNKKRYLQLRERFETALASYNAARDLARQEFAQARGWHYDSKKFEFHYPEVDHAEVFVDARRRFAGLLTHSYASMDEIAAYAAAHDLRAEEISYSWHNPHGCLAVVLEPKKGAEPRKALES